MTTKKIKTSDILGDNYYIYELTSSNYTPALNDTITITCTMKDVYGTAASGKSITLYQNGTSKGTQTTNNNGVATWSVTCSTGGLQKFNIKDRNIEVFVNNILDDFTIKTFTETLKRVNNGGETYTYNTVVGDWEINLDLTNFNGNELTFQGLDHSFTISEGNYYARPCLVVEAGYATIYLTDSYALYDDISSITIGYTSSTKQIYINLYQDNTLIDDTDFYDSFNRFNTVTVYSDGILEGTVTSNLQVPIHYDSFDNKAQIDGDCILVYDMTFIDNNSDPSNYTFVNFGFGEYNGVVRYNNKIYLINEYKDHNNFNGFGDFIESYPVLTTDRQFTVKRYYLAQGAVITEWNDTISIIEQKYWHEGGHDRIYNVSGIDEDESSLVQLASKYIFSDVKSVKSTAKELQTLIDDNRNNKVSSWSNPTTYSHYPSEKLVKDSLDNKQDKLVSGTNLKTLDGISLLGEGDVEVDVSCNSSGVLFEDACSSASGLSSYGSSECVRGSNATITMTYDSTENAYQLSGTGNYHAMIPIPTLNDADNYTITADFKAQNIHFNGIGFFLDNRNDTTSYGQAFWLSVYDKRLDGHQFRMSSDGSASDGSTNSSISANTWYTLEMTVNGDILYAKLYDGDTVLSQSATSLTVENRQMGLFLYCETGSTNSICYVKNIVAKTIGGGGSPIIFKDDCKADNTSDYVNTVHMGSENTNINFTFNSSTNGYLFTGTGGDYFGGKVIPITFQDKITISCDAKLLGTSAYNQCFIGLANSLNPSSSGNFDFFRIRGDNRCDYIHNNNDSSIMTGLSLVNNWVTLEISIDGTSLTGKLYDENKTLLAQTSQITNTYSNPYIFIGLNCNGDNQKYVKNIVVKNTNTKLYLGNSIMTMIETALEHMITNWEDYD